MHKEYVNSRVKGMYSRLLTKGVYSALILKPDISHFIKALDDTPYNEDIERALVTKSGVPAIEEALRINLIRTIMKIGEFLKGEKGEKYIYIFTSRWDIHNLKTILRGKRIQIPSQEIQECLVPAGRFDQADLNELLKQPDIRAVIDLLATWEEEYAVPLTRVFPQYASKGDLIILENALDRYYYEHSLSLVNGKSSDEKTIRGLISTEIDLINLKTTMMMVRDRIEPEAASPIILEGGDAINKKTILTLLNFKTIHEIINFLQQTKYEFIMDVERFGEEEMKISHYEHLLDTNLIKHAVRLYRGDPLSITVVIGYLWAKYTEVMNLRIIARCKDAFLPPEDMEAEMIYV